MFCLAVSGNVDFAQSWPQERNECFGSPWAHDMRASLHVIDVLHFKPEDGQASESSNNNIKDAAP